MHGNTDAWGSEVMHMEIQGSEVVNMDIRGSEYREFNFLENLYGKSG